MNNCKFCKNDSIGCGNCRYCNKCFYSWNGILDDFCEDCFLKKHLVNKEKHDIEQE